MHQSIYSKIQQRPINRGITPIMNDANGGGKKMSGLVENVPLLCGSVVTWADIFVAPHVPFKLLLGRPWQRGNYVSIEERPEGTYVIFRDPKDPTICHELLGVPEKNPHDLYHRDNWRLSEEALPMDPDIFHGDIIYPMTTLMITETQHEKYPSPLYSPSTPALEPTDEKGYHSNDSKHKYDPDVIALSQIISFPPDMMNFLEDCLEKNPKQDKKKEKGIMPSLDTQFLPKDAQNCLGLSEDKLTNAYDNWSRVWTDKSNGPNWFPDNDECEAMTCYGSHMGRRPQAAYIHTVLHPFAWDENDLQDYRVCYKCNRIPRAKHPAFQTNPIFTEGASTPDLHHDNKSLSGHTMLKGDKDYSADHCHESQEEDYYSARSSNESAQHMDDSGQHSNKAMQDDHDSKRAMQNDHDSRQHNKMLCNKAMQNPKAHPHYSNLGVVQVPPHMSPQEFFTIMDQNPSWAKDTITPCLPLPHPNIHKLEEHIHINTPICISPADTTQSDSFPTNLAKAINQSFKNGQRQEKKFKKKRCRKRRHPSEKFGMMKRDTFGKDSKKKHLSREFNQLERDIFGYTDEEEDDLFILDTQVKMKEEDKGQLFLG